VLLYIVVVQMLFFCPISILRGLSLIVLRHIVYHGNRKVDLHNNFTSGNNGYAKNFQKSLHLLDKYSKTDVAKVTQYEGISFAQISGRGGGRGGRSGNIKIHDKFDKEYWKDKTCYKCENHGHPANKCPKKSNNDDDKKIGEIC
jgi:hypothetical protein